MYRGSILLEFIFLIDEWDCVMRERQQSEDLHKRYLDFLRVFDTCQKYKTLQTAEMRAFLCQILFIFMLYGVVLYAIIRYEALVR